MTLLLKDIFQKPVDRPIEGVIKADDEASLNVELDEYVITNEIEKQLGLFLDAYNQYTTANGVWISGFFGSGKSHLLKMLALLLENRRVDDKTAFEFFEKKISDNRILLGDLKKAAEIPSRSILFNIDQKADVISKNNPDALLAVFLKVFDEMCGYYGKKPHIAQFERDLDSRGMLENFKKSYEEIAAKPWERGREQDLFEGQNIAKAFTEVAPEGFEVPADVLRKYRDEHRVSIEDFADMVKAYVDRQEKGFRLNFFVDEVGQYIADNVKLMTNLQTVAESLNTKCRGQAWVIVTAQQDMSSVIGDMTKAQENDFSKIQARFANRIPLNSQDVAEVIQRRLLTKTNDGKDLLAKQFHVEENNLRTLFEFGDGSYKFKSFRDSDHFVSSFPFPNYQYDLFQMAISGLSQHNAFEGRHSSIGERSMLGVFQEVAKSMADQPARNFSTFDKMFEGIKQTLKGPIQQSISIAQKNLDDPFAIQVLKCLFLVKYVKEFKPTTGNLSILMLEGFDQDLGGLRRKIEEALNILESNTLIQRNGEVYEFLTNEEKDIEAEIKSLEVDEKEISDELDELFYGRILKQSKIRHAATGHDYSFSRMLDDRLLRRQYELGINLVTPSHAGEFGADSARMQSQSRDELIIWLEPDLRFTQDLALYKKTQKFIRQSSSGTPQPGRDRIVATKKDLNQKRFLDLEAQLRGKVGSARMFARGEELDLRGDDPQDLVSRAFQAMVDKVYVNLPMLKGVTYSESEIANHLKPAKGTLLDDGAAKLTEAEEEILNFIQSQEKQGLRTSAKSVIEKFEAKPYGWPAPAILCVTASLLGRSRLDAKLDGLLIEANALESALRNNNKLPSIILSSQHEFSAKQIKQLKDFFKEFFNVPPEGGDAKSLAGEAAEEFRKLGHDLENLARQTADFPFLSALTSLAGDVRNAVGKPYEWYLEELPRFEDKFLDAAEDILAPIRSFMGGPQRTTYESARNYLAEQANNFDSVQSDLPGKIGGILDDPDVFKGSKIKDLKEYLSDLQSMVTAAVSKERKQADAVLDECLISVEELPEFGKLSDELKKQARGRFEPLREDIRTAKLIAVIRAKASTARNDLLPRVMNDVIAMAAPPVPNPEPVTAGGNPGPGTGFQDPPAPPPTTVVLGGQVEVPHTKSILTSKADVEEYIGSMREAWIAEIARGKRIKV